MGDEGVLTGTIYFPVSPEPKVIELIKNYTYGLYYVTKKILENPAKYGTWKYSRRDKRLKWHQNISAVHKEFYEVLKKEFRLPPKIAVACFREAIMIAKSILNNPNNEEWKFSIRSYRLRMDNQTYRLLEENGWYYGIRVMSFGIIKIEAFPKEWYEKYKDWKKGDMILKLVDGKIIAYMTVSKRVKLPNPSTRAIAVDLNFREIVVGNEKFEVRIKTPLNRIIHIKKNHIEKVQKKYNKSWRYVKGIRRAISRWWKRIRGILDDFVKRTSLQIVKIAKENGYDTIVLEDLNHLRDVQAKMRKSWRERFTFFAYRKLQKWIEWQAKKHGLAVVYVSPKKTSKICPRCKNIMEQYNGRKMLCKHCGLIMDRDSVAVINLVYIWYSRCGEGGSPRTPPMEMQPQEPMRGKPR